MVKLYRINACMLLLLLLALPFISTAQINTPSGAIVPFGFNTSYGNGILPTNLPSGGTYGQSQDAANAYNTWKSQYISSCSGGQYRVNFDTPSETVSEGIGYGMLLAAYAADQALFNGLYAYYKANSNGNGLMNWHVGGCSGVIGSNGATDSDEDVAMALIIAYNQWPNATSPYNYKTEATSMINKIGSLEIYGNQATNGDGWGSGSSCRNPSYQAPGYYREFGTFVSNTGFWNGVATGAYSLVTANANSSTGLVSDWADNTGATNACNGSSAGTYGYDACRNPWRMATDVIWHGTTTAATGNSQCNKIASFVNSKGAGSVGGPIPQSGGTATHNATFVSTFAMGIVGSSSTYQTLMNQMYSQVINTQDAYSGSYPSGYFGNTLRVLSLFVMTGNFWKPGTTSNQKISLAVTNAATGQNNTLVQNDSTYNFEDVQYTNSSTSTATFTISNPGSKTLTISGSPLVSLTGSSAFTITQPSSSTIAANGSETFTVKFAPTASGAYTATLKITSNDPNTPTYTIYLDGTGTATATAPLMAVNKSGTGIAANGTYNWGYVTVKPSSLPANNPSPYVSYTNFNVTNKGTGPLNITGITAAGTGYAVTTTGFPITVNAGATGTFQVSYSAPTSTGTNTGSITIASNDPINPSYKVNLSAIVSSCADTASTKVLLDYDANNNMSLNFYPNGTSSVKDTTNPAIGPLDSSQTVMRYTRPAAGTYNTIRYQPCTVGGSGNYFSITTHPLISLLIWSPAKGINVTLSPKLTASTSANADVTATTTTVGWNRLYFDLTGVTSTQNIEFLDILVDPQATQGKAVNYYIDDIKYDVNPCISDLPSSGVFDDFDSHINISLTYVPSGTINQAANNPSATGLNTSANVAQYTRPGTGTFATISYNGCNNKITLSNGPGVYKTGISMLVYSPAAGIPVEMSLQNPGSPNPVAITNGNVTVTTTKANQWEELFFDFTAAVNSAGGTATAEYLVLFFDPNLTSPSTLTYYYDDIKYDVAPCISGISTSGVLDDYDSNRWLTYIAESVGATYNDQTANPHSVAPNTSATVLKWSRPATGKYAFFQYQACQSSLTLTQGKTVLSMQVYSPVANVPVTMQILEPDGATVLSTATATITTANSWQTLIFDQTAALGASNAAYMNIMIDTGAANGAQTYYVDNIQYAAAAPYMNVVANGVNKAPGTNVDFGTTTVGGASITYTFSIANDGSQPLTLSGTPAISITGTNASSFVIDQSNLQTSVSPGSSTTFTVTFTPTTGGALAATLTIGDNDTRTGYNPYTIYLNGTASGAKMAVAQGATNITTGGTYTITPAVALGSNSTVTFTIENTGTTALTLSGTPYVAVSGTNSGDFAVTTQPASASIAASSSETFVVTFTPTATGTRTATLTIPSNDASSPYTVLLSASAVPATPTVTPAGPLVTCQGTNVTLTANSTTPGVTYQWSNSLGTITGATNSTYLVSASGTYTAVAVSGGISSASSAGSVIVINPSPATPTISGSPTTICSGSSVTLSASDATGGVTYQWNNSSGAIAGATSATYTATTADSYTVTAALGTCTATSTATAVTVNPTPATPTIVAGGPTTFCSGGNVTLSASDATTGVTYQWYNGASSISGATTANYTASASGSYTVTVAKSSCTATSTATAVTVNTTPPTPTISGSPTTFCAGGSVTLSATPATGYSYQWNNGATPISGATNATYTATTSGNYNVVVGSTGCSATSSNTTVTVNSAPAVPTISGGPTTFCTGGNVTLSASDATGGVTYQWYNGAIISGATNATYTASASGSYTVQATASGCSSTSAATVVTVNTTPPTPTISGSPTTFCAGGSVTLSATPATGYSYQWNNGATPISGATNATYTATTSGNYNVVVGSTGCSATSSNTTVTVNSAPAVPTISGGPTTFCTGGNVILSASDATGGVTYQWYNGAIISGATNATYTASASGSYTVQATASGCSSTSAATVVTVNTTPPTPTVTASGATTFCSGNSVTLSATPATGYSYQWNNASGAIAGATNATYTATTSDSYNVTLGSTGCSATSTNTTVTVNPTPAIPTISGPTSFCTGNNITLSASDATGGVTYQWYNGAIISGATNATYTVSASGSYTVQATTSGCSSTSAVTTVTANSTPPTPTVTASGATTFCSGNSVTLSATPATGYSYQWNNASGAIAGATNATYTATTSDSYNVTLGSTGCSATSTNTTVTVTPGPSAPTATGASNCGTGTVTLSASGSPATYNWYSASTGGSSLGTAATYTTPSISATTTYYVTAVSAGCESSPRIAVVATVNSAPTVTITNPAAVCSPSTVDITAAAVTAGSTAGLTFTYWTDAAATATLSNPSAVSASGTYYVKGTVSTTGCYAISPVTVTVNSTPTVTITNPSAACGSTVDLTASSVTTGSTAGLTFTYWTDAAATSSLSNPSAVSASGTYYIKGTASTGCYAISPVTVSFSSGATVNITNPASVCSPATVDLTASSVTAGSTAGLTFTYWTDGGATNSLSNPSTVSTGGTYYIKGTTSSGCSAIAPVTVTINAAPTVTISNPGAVCAPSTIDITAPSVTGGSSPGLTFTYWTDAAATSSLSTPNAVSASGTYYIKGTTSGGCSTTAPVTVTIIPANNVTVNITGNSTICSGSMATFTANTTGSGLSYQWILDGSVVGSGSTYSTSSLNNQDYIYCVVTSGNLCTAGSPATSNVISATVSANETPAIAIQSNEASGTTSCAGNAINFTIADTTYGGTSPSYQWYNSSSPISGATASSYSSTALSDGSSITCVMTSSLSCVTTSTATSNAVVVSVTAIGSSPCTNPPPQTITGPTTIPQGLTGTVIYSISSPNAGSSYIWSVPPGATMSYSADSTYIAVDLSGVSAGTYSVSVTETNSYGYSTTSSVSITVDAGVTGTLNAYSVSGITVSPNPFNNTTIVNFASTATTQLTIKVIDMAGVTLYTSDAYNTNQNITLGAELPSGMYVVQALYNDQVQTLKIVKSE